MMTIETILVEFSNLRPEELHRWIARRYVRPAGEPGEWRFHEMDVARLRLILDLRDTFEITEPALPTVLSLIDQLYDLRRRMHQLNAALPAELRAALQGHLEG
jgi:chaperone modulatory protein CbpM